MWIVLGLGNPGQRYRATRHNVGYRVVDLLAERFRVRFESDGVIGRTAWTARAVAGEEGLLLAKPRVYMNRSGLAAAALSRLEAVDLTRLLVVFDDADLELGRVRVRPEGGAGGHNGIRSLVDTLRTRSFPRVKLGIKGRTRTDQELSDYVLTEFDRDEREIVERMIVQGADATEWVLREGVESAMREFNGRPPV